MPIQKLNYQCNKKIRNENSEKTRRTSLRLKGKPMMSQTERNTTRSKLLRPKEALVIAVNGSAYAL